MDGVKQQIRARQFEALENKHQFEVKKLKREMKSDIDKLSSHSRESVTRIKKDYDKHLLTEKTQLEVKLIGVRRKNDNILENENKRFEQMIGDLKSDHKSMMVELQISQDNEVQKRQTEHTEYLENEQQKFDTAKAHLEA